MPRFGSRGGFGNDQPPPGAMVPAGQVNLQALVQRADSAAAMARTVDAKYNALAQSFEQLKNELSRVSIQGRSGDVNIQRIENIPGRRIPFDLFVNIALSAGSTATRQGTQVIPQHGPFVAVARSATLLSSYEFTVAPASGTGTTSRFQGRSFGRWRPISSVCDVNDGQIVAQPQIGPLAFPGTGAPFVVSPPNSSPFRSMEGDFSIQFSNQGSSIPRQNIAISSSFWVKGLNEPFEFGALDFFERGEVLQWDVTPTHPLNPAYGNVSAFAANPNLPFIDAQWDAVEGIVDIETATQEPGEEDLVERQPNAILQIGLHGFMIWQPPGAGPY